MSYNIYLLFIRNDMSELNNQIENRDLAHTMALAEAPQRAIARTAFEVCAS
jgi:hypothetical protein